MKLFECDKCKKLVREGTPAYADGFNVKCQINYNTTMNGNLCVECGAVYHEKLAAVCAKFGIVGKVGGE